ncbi:MAG: hypothetical protein EAZ84_10770 [Verrucomicrobia bacterium]|nr:MAG: hypothetical protein EAZ84_10770 [Verrucomicrobiota bacterium]TAE85246.1 MAG: hypothetical protein EAZ82_13410 [Verrucomicrobiota bacterium]TAF23025.1 MAG: hypothetical protein EAZ71_13385 [Verrucomicrobiota bacterium]
MDHSPTDSENLAIRCPRCSQRFKVGIELRERMVECGSCEQRFRVNDDVIVRTKKFYPGENRRRSLDGFSRVPKTMVSAPANFQTVQYSAEPSNKSLVEPVSPLRVVLGFCAVAILTMVALMLIFGGTPGGVLYGTVHSKRLMLAGFTALLSSVLLIAANPRARGMAILGAFAATSGLLSLPYLFTAGNQPVDSVTDAPVTGTVGNVAAAAAVSEVDDELAALKKEINYAPMAREIERFKSSPGSAGRGVAGIWLRGLKEYHRLQVKDYIVRTTSADPDISHMYPRPPDYLMVVSGVTDDLAELGRLCGRFGEVTRVIEPLRVIEVVVDNARFVEGDQDKMRNPQDPSFYELNRRELDSIDLERARRAVVRLATAEPKLYRKDIAARLVELVREGDLTLRAEVGPALLNWGEPGDGAEKVVLAAVREIHDGGNDVPEALVKLLVDRKELGVIPFIDDLWSRDVTKWEDIYADLGAPIEDAVIARHAKGSISLQMSAIRILGRIGGTKSVALLEAAHGTAVPEVRVLIERALAAIRARG